MLRFVELIFYFHIYFSRAWTRSDGLAIDANTQNSIPRYSIDESKTTGEFNLRIEDAEYTDNRKFECKIQDGLSVNTRVANLTVRSKGCYITVTIIIN